MAAPPQEAIHEAAKQAPVRFPGTKGVPLTGDAGDMLVPTSSGHDAERHCRLSGVDARTSPTPPDAWIRMSLAHRGFV